jgi:hypothetical protein
LDLDAAPALFFSRKPARWDAFERPRGATASSSPAPRGAIPTDDISRPWHPGGFQSDECCGSSIHVEAFIVCEWPED